MNVNLMKQNKVNTIDSREVAEMMSKKHSAIMKDIQGSKDGKSLGIIPVLLKSNFDVSNYFIESSYKDASGKENKCYLVTKMGCEMLGNKQQGEKGILFTAKYVERFNSMEQHIVGMTSQQQLDLQTQTLQLAQGMQMIGQVVQGIQTTMSGIQDYVKDSINSKDIQIEQAIDLIGMRDKNVKRLTQSLKDKLADLKGYNIKASDEIYQSAKKKVLKEFNVIVWEDIPVNKFNYVHAYIDTLEKDDI